MSPVRTLVLVGTGAYVTEDPYGPGVVARSLAQWCAQRIEDSSWRIVVLAQSETGRQRIEATWRTLQHQIENAPPLEILDAHGDRALEEIRCAHALFICVPDPVHREYLELGIAANVPTWIVKPMTGEGTTSTALAVAAEERGLPIWVDYHKRFDVSNRLLRSAATSEKYGAPLLYSVRYSQPRDLPLEQFAWARHTDVFSYIGCHYVDQLMFVFPEIRLLRIEASGISGPVHERLGGHAWDTVLARFDGEWRGRPLTAQFEVGWANPLGSPTKSLQCVELSFQKAKLFADQTRRGIETWDDTDTQIPNPYFFSRVVDPLTGQDAYQGYGYDSIRHFLDFTVSGGEEQSAALANDALPWARSAARVDQVLSAVRESLGRSESEILSGKDAASSSD